MKTKVTILGAGNMGTTLAKVIGENGHAVKLWDVNTEAVTAINKTHENKLFLPKIKLPARVTATVDILEAVAFSKILLVAVPSPFLKKTLAMIPASILDHDLIVNCAKGMDPDTLKFMSQMVHETLGRGSHAIYADIAGPTLAGELCEKHLTGMVLASKSRKAIRLLTPLFKNRYITTQVITDIIGAELSGVMKNIYAIGMGMIDTLSPAMNTRALFMTQALREMMLFGQKIGAKKNTFFALAGLGDLMATCMSEHSRNYRLGQLIAKGKTVAQAQKTIHQITEGYFAAGTIHALAKKKRVSLPVAEKIYAILYKGKSPQSLLKIK